MNVSTQLLNLSCDVRSNSQPLFSSDLCIRGTIVGDVRDQRLCR